MRFYLIIINILILVSLSGCVVVSHEEYPKSWNPLPIISNCPSIEGHYDNRGEAYEFLGTSYADPVFLGPILIGSESSNPYAVNSVKITQKKNELIFEAYTNESEILERIAILENEKCSEGLLEINEPDPEGFVMGGGAIGYGSTVIQLAKDSADSLIIRIDSTGFGFMLIPAGVSSWQWFRFSPITEQPIQLPKKTRNKGMGFYKSFR